MAGQAARFMCGNPSCSLLGQRTTERWCPECGKRTYRFDAEWASQVTGAPAELLGENDDEAAAPEVELGLARKNVISHASTLEGAGLVLEVVAIFWAVVGVVAGIVVLADGSSIGSGTGLLLIISALGGGLLYWAIARALRLFAEHVSFQARASYRLLDALYNGTSARTVECPDCREKAWEGATVCPFCSHQFSEV